MNPQELLSAGRLNEAVQALGAELREHPADTRRRTFLFELLCFAGDFERAAKHLNVLSEAGTDTETGVLLYRSAVAAERKRQLYFENLSAEASSTAAEPGRGAGPGTINGRAFTTLEDADPRIGARLEVFVAGEYVRVPFEHVSALRVAPPRLLRDLLWPTGELVAGPAARGREFGEVMLPALYPFSWRHPNEQVRLGRATEWQDLDGMGECPAGQKLLVIDGEEVLPFLEIRELTFSVPIAQDARA